MAGTTVHGPLIGRKAAAKLLDCTIPNVTKLERAGKLVPVEYRIIRGQNAPFYRASEVEELAAARARRDVVLGRTPGKKIPKESSEVQQARYMREKAARIAVRESEQRERDEIARQLAEREALPPEVRSNPAQVADLAFRRPVPLTGNPTIAELYEYYRNTGRTRTG